MDNSNITDFKNDFNRLLRCEDIMEKYKISKTTYHTIVRKLGLKRPKTSKLLRTFNMNFTDDNKPKEEEKKPKTSHIPIDDVYKKIDETDEKLIYERQHIPRNTTINVEKQKTTTKPKPVAKKEAVLKEVDEDELDAILNRADKTIAKIQNKKQNKKDDDNNNSELIKAINKSTEVRQKLVNKNK
jgi:hypothetical protein